MPEFKEKPKMGQPKSKRSAMLDPRHRAVLLKEKYRQQMEQRQDMLPFLCFDLQILHRRGNNAFGLLCA